MVIALLHESELALSEYLVEVIVDKVDISLHTGKWLLIFLSLFFFDKLIRSTISQLDIEKYNANDGDNL